MDVAFIVLGAVLRIEFWKAARGRLEAQVKQGASGMRKRRAGETPAIRTACVDEGGESATVFAESESAVGYRRETVDFGVSAFFYPLQTRRKACPRSAKRKSTTKMKKRIFAIPAAANAIPVKPNIAAISATTKNAIAHRNITPSLISGTQASRDSRLAAFRQDGGDSIPRVLARSIQRKPYFASIFDLLA
jgi:hypothetical protein